MDSSMDTCLDSSLEDRKSTSSFCHDVVNSFSASIPRNSIFCQRYTVHELVTPTKTGYVTMKETSFSVSFSDKCPTSPLTKLISDIPREPEWLDTQQQQISNEIVKFRKKDVPPFKKIKFESHHLERKRRKESNWINKRKGQISESNKNIFQGKESRKLPWRCVLFLPILPLLVVFLLSLFLSPAFEKNLKQDRNLRLTHEALKKDVFGQEEAISSLLLTLESYLNLEMVEEKQMPVILLTGSNGVGKSLTTSIITRTFPSPGEAELILLSPLPSCELLVKKLLGNGPHLIVVDNLNPQLAADTMKWTKNLLNEAVWQQKSVLVLLVFNVQVWSDDTATQDNQSLSSDLFSKGTALFSLFDSSGFTTHHIHFNVLSQEHVKKCIRLAIRKKGLKNDLISEEYVEMLSNQINHREDGCKPVWSRINLIDSN